MIIFSCPNCHQQYRVADSLAGKRSRCPKCNQPVRVPAVKPPVSTEPPGPSLLELLATLDPEPARAEPPIVPIEAVTPTAPERKPRVNLKAAAVFVALCLVAVGMFFAILRAPAPTVPSASPPATSRPAAPDVYQEALDSLPAFAEKVVEDAKAQLKGRKFTTKVRSLSLVYEIKIVAYRYDARKSDSLLRPVTGTIFINAFSDGQMAGFPIVGETVTAPVACSFRDGKWRLDDAGGIGGAFGRP
jgi:predicted Zn finger-like uncharacterized protein